MLKLLAQLGLRNDLVSLQMAIGVPRDCMEGITLHFILLFESLFSSELVGRGHHVFLLAFRCNLG